MSLSLQDILQPKNGRKCPKCGADMRTVIGLPISNEYCEKTCDWLISTNIGGQSEDADEPVVVEDSK